MSVQYVLIRKDERDRLEALDSMHNKPVKPILDACCGTRAFYFDKADERVLFCDIRADESGIYNETGVSPRHYHVKPDFVLDYTKMPFEDDESFRMVIFDPPHLHTCGPLARNRKLYGCLDRRDWHSNLYHGFKECWRVLMPYGTLVFKWNEAQIPLKEIVPLFPEKPICGHTTSSKKMTHWILFLKQPKGAENA